MFNDLTWKEGEELAVRYMKKHGYEILYTNYSCVGVELDIVAIIPVHAQKKILKKQRKKALASEKDEVNRAVLKKTYSDYAKNLAPLLIITEVKARKNENYGTGKESISRVKQEHLIRGARFILKKHKLKIQVRFDVASVDKGVVEYIEDAFNFEN